MSDCKKGYCCRRDQPINPMPGRASEPTMAIFGRESLVMAKTKYDVTEKDAQFDRIQIEINFNRFFLKEQWSPADRPKL